MKDGRVNEYWQRTKTRTGRKAAFRIVVPFIIQYTVFVSSFAQSPYELRTGRELGLLGGGVVTVGAAQVFRHSVDPLTPTEISKLTRADINAFDRNAAFHWSARAGQGSDLTLLGSAGVLGLLTVGTKPMRQDIKTVAVMYIETLLLANGIEGSVKGITQRIRPFVYNPNAPLDQKVTRDARQSFFSGHATNAFATAVFTSEVFRHYFPNSKLKPVVWIGTLGLATATAALRYEGGYHYPTDLLAGAAFGSLVGWGIPKLHQVKNHSDLGRRLDIQPWSRGGANGIYVRLAVFSR